DDSAEDPPDFLPQLDPLALAAALQRGEEEAFAELSLQLSRPLAHYARGLFRTLPGTVDAEDAVQAALLKIWEVRAMFDPQRGGLGWPLVVGRRAILDLWRSELRTQARISRA